MSTLFDSLNPTDIDRDETASVVSVASTSAKIKNPMKRAWCQTQWTNLSFQAEKVGLPDVYFDNDTRLLDKTTNRKLWQLMNRLYDLLGPEKAPYAYPVMLGGGSVEWHNYADGCKGVVAEIVEE
ncbi:hypothetical protein LTR70_009379 [Exophiala xenobiotica]|uniref:Uncharacterized protein n=1 Tax=Lithohypha guttulata TaxID=1690604 RepID=A0ABR0JZ51_9EURO|nr:hypothetical protein LTR24_009238 [Lithohypha guttulata]KAK5310562.1 hypothetical protein LTR70_009379 [Exophiala xenobiotica]